MPYRIYYDSYQEGKWFEALHPDLIGSDLQPFPRSPTGKLAGVLSLDRPDIVLTDLHDEPILVVERTVEVPSGHNVGQRFARLVASALETVPCVYFGPYAAMKHGGETSGPRYMNLRLFKALREVELVEKSPVTTIRWHADRNFELIKTPDKDDRMREYLQLFFRELRKAPSIADLAHIILNSDFEKEQEFERDEFVRREVRRSAGYDLPPNSLQLGIGGKLSDDLISTPFETQSIALYDVGMRKIRSDPYTGTAILYAYLYCGGLRKRSKPLVLRFPHITHQMWQTTSAGRGGGTKTIRLFRMASDAIIFSDAVVLGKEL